MKAGLGLVFSEKNRGLLLDLCVFFANLGLTVWLARLFVRIVGAAADGDRGAGFVLFLFGLGLFVLPPAGAILKRPAYHRRLKAAGRDPFPKTFFPAGCLFSPIVYFCLNVLIFAAVSSLAAGVWFGGREPGEFFLVTSSFFGIAAVMLQTYLVYNYFVPPEKEPENAFLRDPRAALLGDACIFLNVVFYQVLWNSIVAIPIERPAGLPVAAEMIFRLFLIGLAALFVYFPPRLFYLAEDIDRRRTWLTILLAVSPVMVRFLLAGI
ncbi:MAG: hypothetical protein JSS81_10725 [Acidobacteria bacterium]|nr:hypothetical protein [Acidobacteriota bacterium]